MTRKYRMPNRRGFLLQGAAGIVAASGIPAIAFAQGRAPAMITSDKMRPAVPSGVMSGDIHADRAIVWGRSDRAARMVVEYDTTESFRNPQKIVGPYALEDTDFTARVDLTGLPADQTIFYRVNFVDLGDLKTPSRPYSGKLRTAPAAKRDITFLWSGDTCGQGYGINPEWGGMKIYETMRKLQPDFFIHSGDTVYADGPLESEKKLPDGTIWKNIVTEAKSKVAETLAEFRGQYAYNLLDHNVRNFNADVPQIWQWDDHEVTNNWSDSKDLSDDNRYQEKRVPLLTARATRAFFEYAPLRIHGAEESQRVYRKIPYGPSLDVFVIDMRSYRGPNTANRQTAESDQTAFLGRPQVHWLKQGLLASRATWKVIAADMPISLQVPDGKDAQDNRRFEAIANGDGPALGRELEVAGLLRFIKQNGIRNVVWLTADVHYTAAHYYDPNLAAFSDFEPFWEFVSGPLNAGTFGPNPPDNTFGLQVVWQKAPDKGQVNLPPSMGMQFFGEVKIDGRTDAMTVSLKDLGGTTLYKKTLEPAGV
jgi:alkaline phosphatase D